MKTCPNCKGRNVTELVWGCPSKEFLESEQITDLQKKAAGIFSGINEAIILKQEREGES